MGMVNYMYITYWRGLCFYSFKMQIFTRSSWCQKCMEIHQILTELWHHVFIESFSTIRYYENSISGEVSFW